MKLQTHFAARTVALAFFMAMLGFSYSIITQASPSDAVPHIPVGSRSVGSNSLRFLAPVFTANPADYDLGDVLYGSIITRYVTATGGLRPYAFSAPGLNTALGANSTLAVLTSGVVTGLASAATVPPNLTFSVLVIGGTEHDLKNSPIPTASNTFHLNLFPTSAQLFRFANDHLNSGVLGQSYLGKIDTIGAKGSVLYSIVAGSITLNGAQLGTGSTLEDSFGLSLSSDGTMFGRPLKTGLITFKAHAVDSAKRIAKDRNNAAVDQQFAFNIEDARVTATDSTILSVSVKGDTGLANADTVRFKAFMNLSGTNTTALRNQQFAFLFGGTTYTGYMDENGNVLTQRGAPLIFPDGTSLKAKVDSVNGTVTGTLSHANVSKALNASSLLNRTTKRAAVGIIIYNLVAATDTIEFVTKHISTKYSLQYSIGKIGQPLGGAFQVFDARGTDGLDIAGNPGDAWISKFLIAPRMGVDDTAGFSALTNITVRIGTNFTQIIPVSALKVANNGSITLTAPQDASSLKKFVLNTRAFSGSLLTSTLSTNTTGLTQGKDTSNLGTNFFNLAVDVNRVAPNVSFSGEDAKSILKVPVFGKWVDRNTKKPKP